MKISSFISGHMERSIIVALSIATGVFLLLVMAGCDESPAVEGPSTDLLNTRGVFEPGGYINFTLSPEIESVNGRYYGKVETYAVSPDNINIDYPLWPYNQSDIGKDWGDRISADYVRSFSVKHRVSIPNDQSLAGKTVAFVVRYRIDFPVWGPNNTFYNGYESITETILVDFQ